MVLSIPSFIIFRKVYAKMHFSHAFVSKNYLSTIFVHIANFAKTISSCQPEL